MFVRTNTVSVCLSGKLAPAVLLPSPLFDTH